MHIKDIFSIFSNMAVRCVFSLKSHHCGDFNEYTQHIITNIIIKITRNYPKYNNVCSYVFYVCGWVDEGGGGGLKNKFEIAVINEP